MTVQTDNGGFSTGWVEQKKELNENSTDSNYVKGEPVTNYNNEQNNERNSNSNDNSGLVVIIIILVVILASILGTIYLLYKVCKFGIKTIKDIFD